MTIRIALIGYGKIARDEHLPAVEGDPHFSLAAIVSHKADSGLDVPCFSTAGALFAKMKKQLDAVAICTPPAARFAIARDALEAGLDVLLEKPPAATLGELHELERLARAKGQAIYAGWHSQHASGVAQAAEALAGKKITSLDIIWHEYVRKWHPGQDWIWQPGGFGVFDPGINALAIATRILGQPLLVSDATLCVPENKQVPIAASVRFGDAMQANMDWRPTEQEQWTVCVTTNDDLKVELRQGGSRLFIDEVEQGVSKLLSYPSIYARFAELCTNRVVEIDSEPLRIVADILLKGKIVAVESFD